MKKYEKYLISVLLSCFILINFGSNKGQAADEVRATQVMQIIANDMKHERTIAWQIKNYTLLKEL